MFNVITINMEINCVHTYVVIFLQTESTYSSIKSEWHRTESLAKFKHNRYMVESGHGGMVSTMILFTTTHENNYIYQLNNDINKKISPTNR